MSVAYDFDAMRLDGTLISLKSFAGQVLLIVNTASECGFTPQYEALEMLYREYRERGLAVLGFPCNQFGKQEPGSDEEIAAFCETRYSISFPVFAKIDVNGSAAHPLYRWLQQEVPGVLGSERIKWNFTKFLIDRTGHVAQRFAPMTKPEEIKPYIERLLGKKESG
jgi:glutathione peroxidase